MDFYSIKNTKYQQDFYTIKTKLKNEYSIAKHIYTPSDKNEITKKAIFIHGYTENAGYQKNIIEFFISRGFIVECHELPGHGMSSGDKYDIDDFSTYPILMEHIAKQIDHNKTNYFLAHSTGAIVLTSYLKENKNPFEKTIFVAPLTRPNFWTAINIAYKVISPFFNRVRRVEHIRGKGYAWAKKNDPYIYNYAPLHWLNESFEYHAGLRKEQISESKDILVLYGDSDEVIDWKNSREYYKVWYPNAKIKILKGGPHHPYFKAPKVQKDFFSKLEDFVSSKS